MFDPDTFLQQTIDKPLDTEYVIVPVGEYTAFIDDFDRDAFEQREFEYKRGPKAGLPGRMTKFTLPFVINDPVLAADLGRDRLIVTKQIILDIEDDNTTLSDGKGKNIELGRIRAAVGQKDKTPWSISELRGAGPLMVKVTHIEFDRKDGTKGKRAEVERVAPIV